MAVTKRSIVRDQGQLKKKVAVLIYEALFYNIISIISAAVTEDTTPAVWKHDCMMHADVHCLCPLQLKTLKIILLCLQKCLC